MPTTNTSFSALIAAIDSKAQSLASSTTDPKDLVFLGKAVEALNTADTVSAVIDEGDTQVAAVNTAGTTQVNNVNTAGTNQVAAVQAAGASYATQANVDALIAEITVTVANSKFVIDGTAQKAIRLTPSVTYRFDTSDASNAGHPLKFSTTADGTHASPAGTEFTTGVTTVGTAGSANSYVQIIVEQDSPTLYYYCANHSGMGGTAYSAYNVLSTAPTDGQVLTYDAVTAAYVNREATGGGNATMTLVDDLRFLPTNNYQYHSTFSSPSIRRGGYTGNTFGTISISPNTQSANLAVLGNAATVNPSTGALTITATNTQLWLNTGTSSHSTTWFAHPYGTGGVWYGGHNGWPGQSNHYFGYGTAYLSDSGGWYHDNTNNSNADHNGNGYFHSIPTDATSGRFMTTGYSGSDSRVRYRNSFFNNTSFNIGGLANPSSNTSTGYHINFTGNKDATINSNTPVSGVMYRDGASNRRMRLTSRDGGEHEYAIGEWSGNAQAFLLTNGTVVLYSQNGVNMQGNAYNNFQNHTQVWPLSYTNHSQPVHVENNKFIRAVYANDGRDGIALFEINPTTYEVSILEIVQLAVSDYDFYNAYTDFHVIYDNGSPAYIFGARKASFYQIYKVWEWPFS